MSLSGPRPRPTAARFALVLAMTALVGFVPNEIRAADDPQPAKKDSRAQSRPKEVVFTTEVVPAKARPGDTVTFSVKAVLEDEHHIYAYSKTQEETGPRATQFDFFGKGGLTPEGDWTPSVEPINEKDPNFPEIPLVSYHEKSVTWSHKLKIPKDAKPGTIKLLCQASYQICSKESCSFPGQWTLPAALLTIEAAAPAPPQVSLPVLGRSLLTTAFLQADGPQPKRKDSRATLRGKEAKLSASVDKTEVKPGETVVYTVKAKLDAGWHIYKFSKEEVEDGPAYTRFDFFNLGGLTPDGDWTAAAPPIKKKEPVFKNLEYLEFYENEAAWSLKLKVPADAKPGQTTVQCQVSYQICDAKSCQRETFWSMEPITLTVLAGGAPVRAADPPRAAPEGNPAPKSAPTPTETPKPTEAPTPTAVPKIEAAPTSGPVTLNEAEQKVGVGLLTFLLWCAGGGVAALVMPCVWPMIPITVNFFVKQGQKGKSTTSLALAYCLSIIGTFTAIGVLFSVFFGASSIAKLANNPWLNVGVAALFVAFGLSLLGLFEIRLPNFLLNASAQGEGKGGLVGVMFMALTLTITSFTCTFPVVGALVVMAAGGSFFYPIIGLLTFSTVVALPFLFLALSPGLLSKVPKSGDWMNSVKVIGGLIEIGAAFKFANTAELAFGTIPTDAWFNAPTILTLWIVLAAVCGLYLLGLFRTDHDHEEVRVGPMRMVLGSAFLFLALYLAPALFGNPPHGPIYGRLIVGILPPDAGEIGITERILAAGPARGGAEGGARTAKATSNDPATAERQQTSFHGVVWGMSYEAALEKAKETGRPVLIDFTGVNCANCRLMEKYTLPKPEVVRMLEQFVTVQLYTDRVQIDTLTPDQKIERADRNAELEEKLARAKTNPYYVMLTPSGELLGAAGGYIEAPEFIKFLQAGLDKFKSGGKPTAPVGE